MILAIDNWSFITLQTLKFEGKVHIVGWTQWIKSFSPQMCRLEFESLVPYEARWIQMQHVVINPCAPTGERGVDIYRNKTGRYGVLHWRTALTSLLLIGSCIFFFFCSAGEIILWFPHFSVFQAPSLMSICDCFENR